MNQFVFFMAIAASIVLAVEVYKKLWEAVTLFIWSGCQLRNFPIGLVLAVALGYWAIFSYGNGLLFWLGMAYLNAAFKYFDLFTTATLVAGGSGYIYDWVKAVFEARDFLDKIKNSETGIG